MTKLDVIVNHSLSIICPAFGRPPPYITWHRNGNPIPLTVQNVEFVPGGREIALVNAQVEDTAMYTCVAENEAGKSNRHYSVNVMGEYICFTNYKAIS